MPANDDIQMHGGSAGGGMALAESAMKEFVENGGVTIVADGSGNLTTDRDDVLFEPTGPRRKDGSQPGIFKYRAAGLSGNRAARRKAVAPTSPTGRKGRRS